MADYDAKRVILQILCLNFSLQGATLVPTMRKPFDMLVEGLFPADNRGDRISTLVDETTGVRLVLTFFPQSVAFEGDAVNRLIQPGLYANTRALRRNRKLSQDARS